MAPKWTKVDAKTQRLEAGGHVAELRKAGGAWTVWLNGEEHRGLGNASIKRARLGATMWLAVRASVVKTTP